DVNAPAQVAKYGATVAFEARDHFDLANVMQTSAFGGRPQDARQIVDAARRERKAFRSWCEARRVGDGGHFDRALRAVEKRVEHLRVEIAGGNILGAEAVVKPYGRRRRRVICGQIFRALAGCNDLEAGPATPIDHFTK